MAEADCSVIERQVAFRAATDQDEGLLEDAGFGACPAIAPTNGEGDRLPAAASVEKWFQRLAQRPYRLRNGKGPLTLRFNCVGRTGLDDESRFLGGRLMME